MIQNKIRYILDVFRKKESGKLAFLIIGIGSTLWFLIRVLPKPSRASHPCMRTAAPIMSAFIIYLISLTTSVLALKKTKRLIIHKKYVAAFAMLIASALTYFISQGIYTEKTNAATISASDLVSNSPIGEGYGIDPGRVVWVYDEDATNSYLSNEEGDYWWMDKNTDQEVVQQMLDDGIKDLAKETSVKNAWLALFNYHDEKLGRADKGYSKGDKIFIKVNLTRSAASPESDEDMDSSPHLMLALLKQLIDEAGVDQSDITMGDPFRLFRQNYYDKLNGAYPNVTWIDNKGGNGRVKTTLTEDQIFHTSDGKRSGRIPQVFVDAKYFINMACLKVHDAAGITLCAKNHQGSLLNEYKNGGSIESNSMYPQYHYCYPTSPDYETMGKYRHLVDYMGHEYLGGNTVLNVIDGLWPGRQGNAENAPVKYQMAPFNDDYASSIFLSQDRVAIEAVGYDFLFNEYSNYQSDHERIQDPMYAAVPDYIEQAADPSLHAVDYDPEDDGTDITESMGVFEHWNNAQDKEYSRNLKSGDGIFLAKIIDGVNLTDVENNTIQTSSLNCYPNPVVDKLNISFKLEYAGNVIVSLISVDGKTVFNSNAGFKSIGEHTISQTLNEMEPGNYICRLSIQNTNGWVTQSSQIVIQ